MSILFQQCKRKSESMRIWQRRLGSAVNISLVLSALFLSLTTGLKAAEVKVAVATNFAAPMQSIAKDFAAKTGHRAVLAFGSSGQLYAQIKNGAPFEVFLSADQERPQALIKEGLVAPSSVFTYAIGRLALWSQNPSLIDRQNTLFQNDAFDKIAIANPKLAPYGLAATQTIQALGLTQALQSKLIIGVSIGQVFQFVATENAPLGFVALSQVYSDKNAAKGSLWKIPASLHAPIRQDAVLLRQGQNQPAAQALIHYLQSQPAKALIAESGYDLPSP